MVEFYKFSAQQPEIRPWTMKNKKEEHGVIYEPGNCNLQPEIREHFLKKIRELIICYCFVSLFWNLLLKSAFARNSEFSK